MKEKIYNFLNNVYKKISLLHFIIFFELSIIIYLFAFLTLTMRYLENGFWVVSPTFEATPEFSIIITNSMNPLEYLFYFILLLSSICLVISIYKLFAERRKNV